MTSPKHIAIIMDGNGRWGIAKKNSRNYGHKKGLVAVEKVIDAAIEQKIKYLTLYVFSTENWKRPINKINYLLKLLSSYISKEIKNLLKRDIKIKIIGNIKQFPKELKLKLQTGRTSCLPFVVRQSFRFDHVFWLYPLVILFCG